MNRRWCESIHRCGAYGGLRQWRLRLLERQKCDDDDVVDGEQGKLMFRDPLIGQWVHARLGREKMELTSPGNPCDRARGEPTSHASPPDRSWTLGDDPGAESVVRSITDSFGSIERLVCQYGSCFVGGGGTRCRISRPCAKNCEGSVDRRSRAANQAPEVPLGKSVAASCAGRWAATHSRTALWMRANCG